MADVTYARADAIAETTKFLAYPLQALLATALLAFGVLYAYFTWNFDYWRKRGYPYLKPTPFVGNFADMFLFRKSVAEFFRDVYSENPFSEVVGLILFRQPVLVLRNRELIKKVLIKDFDHFRDRTMHADMKRDRMGSTSLFTIKTPQWRPLRSQLSPLFTGNKIRSLTQEMHAHALRLARRVQDEHAQKSQPAELKELCGLYTTDVIGSAAWGVDAGALSSPESSQMHSVALKLFTFNLRRAFELTSCFFMPAVAKFFGYKLFSSDSSESLRDMFWKVTEEREKDMDSGLPTRTGDLIEALINLKKNPPKDGLDYSGDVLVAQAATFFTAGYETSSTTLSFTLYEMAFNPAVQEKIHKEVSDICRGSPSNLNNESVAKMMYLDKCIKETLRKYPPLSFLDRLCTKQFTWIPTDPDLKPITIEKGTPVYIPMLGIHMDPSIHHNPEVWDPERFDTDRKTDGSSMDYFPFGSGPRNCIGERFGLMQVKFGLAALVLSFKMTPAEGSVPPARLTINKQAFTMQSNEPLIINFSGRSSNSDGY